MHHRLTDIGLKLSKASPNMQKDIMVSERLQKVTSTECTCQDLCKTVCPPRPMVMTNAIAYPIKVCEVVFDVEKINGGSVIKVTPIRAQMLK